MKMKINTVRDSHRIIFKKKTFSCSIESDCSHFSPPTERDRPRRATYTIYEMKQPSSDGFFTERNVYNERYSKEKPCAECYRRNRIIEHQKQDLSRLYEQNKLLKHELRSTISINQQYEHDLTKLKHHLNKVNSHLYEYQTNFDGLKQKILSDKKKYSKENHDDEHESEEETTVDHIKRLRYEIQMYNRIVAAKEKEQDKHQQKQNYYLS